jgi:hypothetical protein
MTHGCERNGTTTLFAALNVLTGVVTGQCLPRHRNGDKHPRFHLHFIPTSAGESVGRRTLDRLLHEG